MEIAKFQKQKIKQKLFKIIVRNEKSEKKTKIIFIYVCR